MPAIPDKKDVVYRVLGVDQLVKDQNAITDILRMLRDAKTDGIQFTMTENNITIKVTKEGLPAGYTFEEFTICEDGTPATRWIPTWTSNPT